jgi:hypothetical protein
LWFGIDSDKHAKILVSIENGKLPWEFLSFFLWFCFVLLQVLDLSRLVLISQFGFIHSLFGTAGKFGFGG